MSAEGITPFSSITLHPLVEEDEDDVGGASYLSLSHDVDSKHFICRRHFHDGSVLDYGHAAVAEPELARNSPFVRIVFGEIVAREVVSL